MIGNGYFFTSDDVKGRQNLEVEVQANTEMVRSPSTASISFQFSSDLSLCTVRS